MNNNHAAIESALQGEYGFKPKASGGGLTAGRCPACAQPEAYTPAGNPHIIICPHTPTKGQALWKPLGRVQVMKKPPR